MIMEGNDIELDSVPEIVVGDEPKELEKSPLTPLMNGLNHSESPSHRVFAPHGDSPFTTPYGTPQGTPKNRRSNGHLYAPGGSPTKSGSYGRLGLSNTRSVSSMRLSASREDIADMHVEQKELAVKAPVDRFWIVMMIMALHGIAALLPWNMFITASAYFTEHKFGNVSDNAEYKDKFVSYLGIAGFIPNVFFLAVSLFVPPKSSRLANIVSLNIVLLLFILTSVMAVVDSTQWPGVFFGITMATIVIFNGATAVYQSGLFAFSAKLPPSYSQSFIVGQGIGGTFASVISIITLATTDSVRTAAIAYFLSAVAVLFLAVLSLFLVYRMPFVIFHHNAVVEVLTIEERAALETITPPLLQIFKKIAMQAFSAWLVFFVSLALFPALCIGVESTAEEPLSEFTLTYFTPLTCFLTFNICDFIGCLIPALIRWPFPDKLWLAAVSRLLFFPLFIFCNYRPDTRTLPVYFNDYVYITLMVLFSLSSGYFKTVSLMEGPQKVPPEWAGKAASMMVFFLVLGIFCGLQFSLFFPWFIKLF